MKSTFIYNPPRDQIPILYEDDQVMVVDKPAGLLSVPGRLPQHQDSLFNRLKAVNPETLLVHRLDMDTSGVMVFAKTAAAQKHLNRLFETRKVGKTYLAEVSGQPTQNEGQIDLPLMADWPNRPLQKVDAAGKPSLTRWNVLERGKHSTFVELHPETGRSHQLRVHMAEIGHPILGDRFYAKSDIAAKVPRLHLHAYSLTFPMPNNLHSITIIAPCIFFEPKSGATAL